MGNKRKPSGYWTIEKCQEEAIKYKTKKDFRKNSISSYNTSYINKWLDKICKHMEYLTKQRWFYENVKIEALKYSSRMEFKRKCSTAYNFCIKYQLLDEFCSHMKPIGHLHKRLVYTYIFPDKSFYIGLTCDIKYRDNDHFNLTSKYKTAVAKHISKTWLLPTLTYTELMDVSKAQKLECETIQKYINEGYTPLNIATAGGLGSDKLKWTKELVIIEALKYNNKLEFRKKSGGAYCRAEKNGYLKEVCQHMIPYSSTKWSLETCEPIAKQYASREDLKKNNFAFYRVIVNRKWLTYFFPI